MSAVRPAALCSAKAAHRGLVLAIILVGYLLVVLDVPILMAALPRIHADLGFSATGLSWAQNAYTFALAVALLARPRRTISFPAIIER